MKRHTAPSSIGRIFTFKKNIHIVHENQGGQFYFANMY